MQEFITFEDKAAKIRTPLEQILNEQRNEFPQRPVSLSALVREMILLGISAYKAEQKGKNKS